MQYCSLTGFANRHARYLLTFLFAAIPQASNADSVNGVWCSKDGQFLEINGDEVTTPSGETVEGSNDRHHFVFDEVRGSSGEFKTLDIVLVDSNTIHIRYYLGKLGVESPNIESWTRCGSGNS